MKGIRFKAVAPVVLGLLATVLGACGEVGGPSEPAGLSRPRFDVVPPPSAVIVPIGDAGAFTNAIVADNSLRLTTEFWDNTSADNPVSGSTVNCNIGHYATGSFSDDCANDPPNAAASNANKGGYSKYFGDGVADLDAAGFMFKGNNTYTVTLRGSYNGQNSQVGWFTVTGGVYTFHEIPAWSARTINAAVLIDPLGKDWGFYINNTFNTNGGGCQDADHDCSDATGGFTGMSFQQFALMINATSDRYLVGAEDNKLELLPNGFTADSDYNDYIWSLDPTPVPEPPVAVCDFITFGRLVTTVGGNKVVISGNVGGFNANGTIKGEYHIDVNGVDNHVSDPATYGPITIGPLFGLPNARITTGIAKNGNAVELRLWDGGEPGKNTDRVYVKINGVAVLGATGPFIDQGNMQYHPECRGP